MRQIIPIPDIDTSTDTHIHIDQTLPEDSASTKASTSTDLASSDEQFFSADEDAHDEYPTSNDITINSDEDSIESSSSNAEPNPRIDNDDNNMPRIITPEEQHQRQRIVIDEYCRRGAQEDLYSVIEAQLRDRVQIVEHRNPDLWDPDFEPNIPVHQAPTPPIDPLTWTYEGFEQEWLTFQNQLISNYDQEELEMIRTYWHAKVKKKWQKAWEAARVAKDAESRSNAEQAARLGNMRFEEVDHEAVAARTNDDARVGNVNPASLEELLHSDLRDNDNRQIDKLVREIEKGRATVRRDSERSKATAPATRPAQPRKRARKSRALVVPDQTSTDTRTQAPQPTVRRSRKKKTASDVTGTVV